MNSFANFFVFPKLFAKFACPRSRRLYGHNVGIVVNYADIVWAWSRLRGPDYDYADANVKI